jgi:hypothetical protein
MTNNDDYIKELGEAIYRDRVHRARLAPPGEKMRDGPQLFDFACRITMCGIRHQFPEASEQRVREILVERLELQKRLERIR